MKNIKHLMEEFVIYYNSTRRVGHTTTMLKGANESACLVVVHNSQWGRELQRIRNADKRIGKSLLILPINGDMLELKGMRLPLAFDNFAIEVIFRGAIKRIDELEKEVEEKETVFEKIKRLINK